MTTSEFVVYAFLFVITYPFWSGVMMGLSGIKRSDIIKDIDK